jgi:heterodisulfide reductase subunit C
MTTEAHHAAQTLAARLEQATGVRPATCYQCGKCSAGCPATGEMDETPSRLLRMLQLELPQHEERILRSRAIWMCVGCETCVTRCPQEVDLPRAMDYLRKESVERDLVHPEGRDVIAFHRSFMSAVEKFGRLFEFGMIVEYKLRTGHLMQDVLSAPVMFAKGKVPILPHKAKGAAAIARIFERVRKAEAETAHAAGHAGEGR